jgi:hypothetical protein
LIMPMNEFHEIGRVALLQVAPIVPKFSGPTHEVYDPAPLRTVDYVLLSERGVIGVTGDGEQIVDVHHVDHPQSRFRGTNGVSVGFTGHYAALRAQFGAHVVDGCAAENILIEASGKIALDEPQMWLMIEQAATKRRYVLGQAVVAEPCMPFARWVAQHSATSTPDQIRTTLQQLRHGMRGFYLDVPPVAEPLTLQPGDRVLVSNATQAPHAYTRS